MRRVRRLTGLPDWRIREWSDLGLIGEVERTEGHWRIFTVDQVELLGRIRELHGQGLNLAEIRAILRKDGSALGRHIARRKGELARLVSILARLEQAAADLEQWQAELSA